jgi:hypothetical protein
LAAFRRRHTLASIVRRNARIESAAHGRNSLSRGSGMLHGRSAEAVLRAMSDIMSDLWHDLTPDRLDEAADALERIDPAFAAEFRKAVREEYGGDEPDEE